MIAEYDVAVAEWFAQAGIARGATGGRTSPGWRCARRPTLRYGENPHQPAALYADPGAWRPGWRRRNSCTARRCRTTTTSTPTPPGARPTTSPTPAVAIIKHANPCGIAVGADVAEAHRKAHACDPVSAFGGVIAVNRPVTRRAGQADRGHLHRGGGRTVLRGRCGRGARREEEPAAAARAGLATVDGGVAAGQPAACWCRCADRRRRARRRRRRHGGWPPVQPCPTTRWPTSRSPGGRCARSSRTRSCSPPAARRSGVGMGQVNRVDSARLAVPRAGRPGRRVGRRVRRVLPVPGRAAGAHRRRRARGGPAGRLGTRRRGDRGRRGGRRDACT